MVKLKGVKKHYQGFDLDCSMEVQNGCITGLIGKNGAGKSTTFKAVLGLLKPDYGEIQVLGKSVSQLEASDKEKIGVVLADSGFSGYLTIKDLLPVLDNMYEKFDRNDFVKKCKNFSLPIDKKIKDFSTGMKRKLQVLAAVSHGADLLILDEPTAGLDPKGRDDILDQIAELHKVRGITIILVSHSMEDVAKYTEKVLVMNHGKVAMFDEVEKVFSRSREIEAMGLAVPQVSRVFLSLSEKGWPVPANVYTVDQAKTVLEKILKQGGSANA